MGLDHPFRRTRKLIDHVISARAKANRNHNAIQRAVAESMESRTMLSNYTVNSLADDGSGGTNDLGGNLIVTLRWAIQQAESVLNDSTVTVGFSPSLFAAGPAVITLSGAPLEFNGTDGTVEVDGPGANLLSVDAESQSAAILIDPEARATIDGLTVTGGVPGIRDNGLLELNQSTVAGNMGNAGIQADGVLIIADSTISGNTNTQSGFGGGILCYQYTNLTITNSTIAGNSASYVGGGIYTYGDDGAGSNGNFGNVTITNSTISNNTSPDAGGISIFGSPITLLGTIVAGNNSADDIDGGSVLGTNDLIGNANGEVSTDSSSHNIVGVTDPELGPLNDYGGPTQTMPPLPGSPAIGAGIYSGDPCPPSLCVDQRGFPLPFTSARDIGAVQTQSAALTGNNPLFVNSLAVEPGPGQLDFDAAVNLAGAMGGDPPITFDPGLLTGGGGSQALGSLFSISAPQTITEGESDSISFSAGTQVGITSWTASLTDAQGDTLAATQTVPGSSGSESLSDAETSDVIATLTAYAAGGAQFQLPAVDTQVLHDAPAGLSVTSFSSGQIDLSWTDHSPTAEEDFIYESTDLGVSFQPIDQVGSNTPGSGNAYAATGLSPGTPYEFYVAADGELTESAQTNIVLQATPFVAPTLDVEGSGTVVEGQPYELSLAADYPDDEPGHIDHWLVDWNDGPGATSNVSTYTYAAGADPTQPLVVTHTFAAGIASPNVVVTAVDSAHGQWTADPQAVAVTPVAPVLNSVNANGNSITASWGNASNISTGTTVLLSTDGTNFFEYGDAASGATSLTVSNLNLHTEYWVETLTDSVNGISPASSDDIVNTPYVQPTLVVTAPYPATVGQQYTLDCSATYAPGTLQSDMIASWAINWGEGSGLQTYGSAAGIFTSPTGNYAAGNSQVQITAIDGNGNPIGYPTQNVTFSAPGTYSGTLVSSTGPYSILPVDAQIVVGGTGYVPVEFNGPLSVNLSYTSSDPSVMTSIGWGPDDYNGDRQLIVQGVSEGTADIIVSDGLGDVNYTRFATAAPGVTVNNSGDETEGVTYGPGGVIPGFTFTLDDTTSLSPVTINFSTAGSTLPTSLWSNLTSGSLTIPAGVNSLFVPFSTSDDGKIAPTRAAVITLMTPGDLYSFGDQTAIMNVVNTDVPCITMNGASNNATIPLDPQGDNTKLTDIALSLSYYGSLVSTTLTWDPNAFVMWPTRQIGTVGVNDLANIHVANGFGASFDQSNGLESFTWAGAFSPSNVYGQAMTGSSDWDKTPVQYAAQVMVAGTPYVLPAFGGNNNIAKGTANGPEILWGSKVVTGIKAGPVVVGQGVSLSIQWAGPGSLFNNSTQFVWSNSGYAVAGYTFTDTSATVAPLTSGFTSPLGNNQSVHLFWVSGPPNVNVTCSWGYGSASTTFQLVTPKSSLSLNSPSPTEVGPIFNGPQFPFLHLGPSPSPVTPGRLNPGASLIGHATLPSFTGGTIGVIQIATDIEGDKEATGNNDNPQGQRYLTGYANAADGPVPEPDLDTAQLNHNIAAGIATVSFGDSPKTPLVGLTSLSITEKFSDYLMFRPDGSDTIWVPLRKLSWAWGGSVEGNGNKFSAIGVLNFPDQIVSSTLAVKEPRWSSNIGGPIQWRPLN